MHDALGLLRDLVAIDSVNPDLVPGAAGEAEIGRFVATWAAAAAGLEVHVEEVFFHCGKAFLRSQLWKPETWNPDAVPSRACIAQQLERPNDSLEELERYYGEAYSAGLY